MTLKIKNGREKEKNLTYNNSN